jgi:hypothetical protein
MTKAQQYTIRSNSSAQQQADNTINRGEPPAARTQSTEESR